MSMHRILPAVAFLCICILALAVRPTSAQQPGGSIAGVVVAAATGDPLGSVSVAVMRATDSVVVGGRVTAADGRFQITGLAPGSYVVRASLLGFTSYNRSDVTVSAGGPAVNLGNVALQAVAVALQGVTVQAVPPPVVIAADRTIYSTRNMPVAEGGTATDALRTVPEIEVDIEGKVSMRGTGVQVQLNGRRSPLQGEALNNFLQQLPANRIDRIEVIPNPSARYEADGQGGIINIVLRENVDLGLSGTLSLNSSTRGQNGLSARLSYQQGRLTFFGGGSLSLSDSRNVNSDIRENRITDPVTILGQETRMVNESLFGSGDLTAEFKLSDKGTLWAEFQGYRADMESSGVTAYSLTDAGLAPLERYDRGNDNDGAFFSSGYSLGFRHAFQPQKQELTVELRHSDGASDSDTRSSKTSFPVPGGDPEDPPELTLLGRDEGNGETVLAANYQHPFGDLASLEAGYSGTRRTTDNDQLLELFVPDTGVDPVATTPNAFDFTEQFHALYLTANQRVGRFALQAGLRAEAAETVLGLRLSGDEYANDYRSLFPSANVSYELGDGKQLRLMYSKRVQRPYVFYLNPINPSTDPLNRQVGNPDLLPMYTHSFGLDASWNGEYGTLRVAPYYRRTVDSWDQFKEVDEQGVSTVTWKNLASLENYGANFIGQLRQIGPLGGFFSFNLWREERDIGSLDVERLAPGWRWSTNANATLRLAGGLMMQGSANYSPARDLPQGRITTTVFTSIGVRKQFWGTKASVNLMAIDPFDVYRYRFETHDRTHAQTATTQPSMRRATLSVSYNFGRPPQSQRRSPAEETQGAPDAAGQIR